MPKQKGSGIEHRRGAGGESAYVGASRVRVSDIARQYSVALDELVIERIQRAIPHLTPEQIYEAIKYWRNNRKEIEAEIEHENALIAKIPSAW